MKSTVNQRVTMLRTHLGIGQNEFAGKAGLSGPSIWRIEGNEVVPQRKTLKAIADAHGASFEWLMNGTGEMMAEATEEIALNPWKDEAYAMLRDQMAKKDAIIDKLLGLLSASGTNFLQALSVSSSSVEEYLRARQAA